jgi:hypothetical protein
MADCLADCADSIKRKLLHVEPSGRPQPRDGQRQRVVLHDHPALGNCVSARGPKFGHRPIADLGVSQVIQRQLPANPARLVIDYDFQQAPTESFVAFVARGLFGAAGMSQPLLPDIFSHAAENSRASHY